jgi:hypothetical protein
MSDYYFGLPGISLKRNFLQNKQPPLAKSSSSLHGWHS